ncbi:MAG: EH signature domain-containing protein [Glaciecola sp.]|jgi:hypothetical protein
MRFRLSDETYLHNINRLANLSQELRMTAKKAGTDNPKFEASWRKLFHLLNKGKFEQFKIESRFDVRALSLVLTAKAELRDKVTITKDLLETVDAKVPTGSTLFIESLFQYFLSNFNTLNDPDSIGRWLCVQRKRKKLYLDSEEKILSANGPSFLAKQAITKVTTFDKQVSNWKLNGYASGDFIKRAQSIYFVEQLQNIPVNQPHELLEEISKETVANSRYDANELIGHVALRILIDRAPESSIHESWQNAVIAIAGDPRVPKSHSRFIKWWSQLSQQQNKKVQSWLSKLDLKLFLEALEDYSKSSRDADMMRMFPSRKHFLEGMHEAGTIVHTKLYLSKKAENYILGHYKEEHIPDYSIVEDGDRSIIYAELTKGHMIEGSHNCQIWFYKDLHESAPVVQFGKQRLRYDELTGRMSRKMQARGYGVFEHFTHVSSETYKWQQKSVDALKRMGVKIKASDVLSKEDYKKYKRMYGVG